MKGRLISGIIILVLGLLIAIGPYSIFPVCGEGLPTRQEAKDQGMQMGGDSSDKPAEGDAAMAPMVMKCAHTAKAEFFVGILLALIGVLLIALKNQTARVWLSVLSALGGVIAILLPTTITGVCGNPHMTCRALTLPALIILASAVILASVINAIVLAKSLRKE